jgi:hypothetical protein
MMRGEKPLGAFGIRNIGGMYQHAHQEPIGVNPALPFAPVDLFLPHRRRALRLLRSF